MYQGFIQLSNSSYIEITTRLYDGEERVVLALRGTKDDTAPALVSVVIENEELEQLLGNLQGAKKFINKGS